MRSEREVTSDTFPLRLYGILFLATACFMALGTWSTYHGVWRQDQYQLMNLGQVVYDGGKLYIDCWENKPPGVPWIVAALLWLSGGSYMCAWVFPGVLGFAGIAALSWSLRRVFGLAESIAVSLLACVIFSARAYDTPSNHPDSYSAVFALIGTSMFLVALKRPSRARFLSIMAGLTWGLSVISRQTGITGPAILIATTLFLSYKRPVLRTHYLRAAAFAFSGCIIVIGAATGVLWWRGNLGEAYHAVFTFNQSLLTQEHWAISAQNIHRLVEVHGPLGLPLIFALLSVLRPLLKKRAVGMDYPCVLGLALWFIVDNWLSLLGPSQIDRYWMATWTPLLFLAADGFSVVVKGVNTLSPYKRRCVCAVAAVLAIGLTYPLVERYINGRYYDGFICSVTHYMTRTALLTERGTLKAIGRRVQDLVPEREKIYVLKYDPGIYVYARRACASRFTYPRSAGQQDEVLGALERDSAALILVPVDTDPGPEWRMTPEGVDRLYQVMRRYDNLGSYLGYRFMLRSKMNRSD